MKTKEFTIESKTHGKFKVLVDAEDWERVSKHTWGVNRKRDKFYARTYIRVPGHYLKGPHKWKQPKYNSVGLHRLILDAPPGKHVDHINGDTLDNRKCNLRLCSIRENLLNRGPNKNNTSGYKGVMKSLSLIHI